MGELNSLQEQPDPLDLDYEDWKAQREMSPAHWLIFLILFAIVGRALYESARGRR